MSNSRPEHRNPIELLESRTMFDATSGPNFAAMIARVQDVAALQLRAGERIQQSTSQLSAAQLSAAEVQKNGKALLAADRQAIKDSADATSLAAAKSKLAADKLQLKADVLAAKAQIKSLKGDYKSGVADLKSQKKTQMALLKTELASSDVAARNAVRKLLSDWQSVQAGSDLTSADVQKLGGDLRSAADGATQPSAASVIALRTDAIAALADGALTAEEENSLTADFRNVFSTAGISDENSDLILADATLVIDKLNLSNDEVVLIASDVESVFAAYSGA
jgi:hypothetical protein